MNICLIEYRELRLGELYPCLLDRFERYQVTDRALYKENNRYAYREIHFIDHWAREKKTKVIQSMIDSMNEGGTVIGAFSEGNLKGFAALDNIPFGSKNQYLEMFLMHVSREMRGRGIGRRLFTLCCEKAREKSARKIYISAHPSAETQAFYSSVGCVSAEEINEEILAHEPLDIQMEFVL